MKIVQFIESAGPGGAERVVVELSKGLRAAGAEVHVLTLRQGWLTETLTKEGIQFVQLKGGGSIDFALTWQIAKYLRTNHIDAIHSHLLDSNFYAAQGALLARVNHIATEHGDVHHLTPKRFLRSKLLLLRFLKTRVVAVSKFTAHRLIELGLSPKQISILPNPIALHETDAALYRTRTREQLGISAPDHWLWLHVANLRPVKDQTTLITGFAQSLTLSHRPQTLCIIGEGAERPKLEELTKHLGIESKVVFLGHRDNVNQWLAGGDGFILSSISESMPMALLEASALGLLPIVSDVGGMPEIVTPDCGYTFAQGDASDLAKQIALALDAPARSAQMSENITRKVREGFNLPKVVSQYLGLYALA